MKNEAMLKKALSKHHGGKFVDARNIYLKILRKNPSHLDALYLLGTLYGEHKKMGEAIRCLEKAAKIKPDSPMIQNNLGNAYRETGDTERAQECYRRALTLDPTLAQAHHGLGLVLEENFDEREKAIPYFQKALALDPNLAGAHQSYGNLLVAQGSEEGLWHLERASQLKPHLEHLQRQLGIAYLKFGRSNEAVSRLELALKQKPDDAAAKYFLAIAQGRQPDKETRERYVGQLFDDYSGRFEHDLVERLDYKIPAIAREMVEDAAAGVRFQRMADLGCGTGLGGMVFRDCVEHMTGIDISEKMLETAAQKKVYDTLLQGEVSQVLEGLDCCFDLLLATDVMIYLQELDNLFAAIKKCSAPGALFVFSTESYEGDGFAVQKSGRIAHSPKYIHTLADSFNAEIVTEKRLPLRKEKEGWAEGDLFVLKLL